MAIPNVNPTIKSGGLGIILPGNGATPCVAGWTSGNGATPWLVPTIQTFSQGGVAAAQAYYGSGQMLEALAALLAAGTPQVMALRIYDGTNGALVHTGTGPVGQTISGSPTAPFGTPVASPLGSTGIIFKITLGGTLGTFTFAYSLDGGNTYSNSIVSTATFLVPNTGLTITFPAGTYVINDTYRFPISTTLGSSSAVQQLGPNGGTAQGLGSITMDATNNPQDSYNVIILIAVTGATGAGQYSVSLDGGITFSSNTLIPSSNPSNLGGGVFIDWSNTGGAGVGTAFQAGDTYSFTTTPPAITATDIVNATTNIAGAPQQFDWMQIVGGRTSLTPSTMAALVATLDTQANLWFANNRFAFFVMEGPIDTVSQNIDASLISATTNTASDNVVVGVGDCSIASAISGSDYVRNAAWEASIRMAGISIGTDPAWVALGPLGGVPAIFRDENLTPGLDAARFTTLRTIRGRNGYFLTNVNIFSASSSLFKYAQHRRIMNVAVYWTYQALLPFLSSQIRTVASTGRIFETDARNIEQYVTNVVANQTSAAGQCQSVNVIVDRNHVINPTNGGDGVLPVTVGILPFAYAKQINVTLGFQVPGLSTPQQPSQGPAF